MRIFIRVQEPLLHFNDLRGASVRFFFVKEKKQQQQQQILLKIGK